MNTIETFWAKLTPIQRAILITVIEFKYNWHTTHSSSLAERLVRIEKAAEGGLGQLTENVHRRICDLVNFADSVSLEAVLLGLEL